MIGRKLLNVKMSPTISFVDIIELGGDFFLGIAGPFDSPPEVNPLLHLDHVVVVLVEVFEHFFGVQLSEVLFPLYLTST